MLRSFLQAPVTNRRPTGVLLLWHSGGINIYVIASSFDGSLSSRMLAVSAAIKTPKASQIIKETLNCVLWYQLEDNKPETAMKEPQFSIHLIPTHPLPRISLLSPSFLITMAPSILGMPIRLTEVQFVLKLLCRFAVRHGKALRLCCSLYSNNYKCGNYRCGTMWRAVERKNAF